jgi:hypothetical protein
MAFIPVVLGCIVVIDIPVLDDVVLVVVVVVCIVVDFVVELV